MPEEQITMASADQSFEDIERERERRARRRAEKVLEKKAKEYADRVARAVIRHLCSSRKSAEEFNYRTIDIGRYPERFERRVLIFKVGDSPREAWSIPPFLLEKPDQFFRDIVATRLTAMKNSGAFARMYKKVVREREFDKRKNRRY